MHIIRYHFIIEETEDISPIGCRSEYNSEDFESGGRYEEFANKFSNSSLEELLEIAARDVREVSFARYGGEYTARSRVILKNGFGDTEQLFYGDAQYLHQALFVALAAFSLTNEVHTQEERAEALADIRRQLAQVQNDPNLTIVTHHGFKIA